MAMELWVIFFPSFHYFWPSKQNGLFFLNNFCFLEGHEIVLLYHPHLGCGYAWWYAPQELGQGVVHWELWSTHPLTPANFGQKWVFAKTCPSDQASMFTWEKQTRHVMDSPRPRYTVYSILRDLDKFWVENGYAFILFLMFFFVQCTHTWLLPVMFLLAQQSYYITI